jgi:hypothetical protein
MALGHLENETMKAKLPGDRTMNSAFKEKGRLDVVTIDVFEIDDGDLIKLSFESTMSPWRQGVWLKTDECMVINQQQCPSAQLWQDTATTEVLIECHTIDKRLHLYNIWDKGKGYESQSWTSGMLVEELSNGRRYRCNDIGFDTDFTKLVFRIERIGHKSR